MLFKLLILSATHLAISNCSIWTMLGEWNLTLTDECSIQLSHPLNKEAFVSDANIIQVGKGNVDEIPIIQNGDIQQWPNASNYSQGQICPKMKQNNGLMSAQIEGFLNVPIGENAYKKINYNLTVSTVPFSNKTLKINAQLNESAAQGIVDFIQLNFRSKNSEEIYGMGLQYTVWNFKGLRVPVISSEGGVGRGLEPLTGFLNTFHSGQGGNNLTTYAPSYSFISNQDRGMIVNSSYIGYADYTQDNTTSILLWHALSIDAYIFVGLTPKALVTELTCVSGRMRPLPSWIQNGAVIGLQGGQDKVTQNYNILKSRNVSIAAVWMQDWVGTKEFPEGVRLMWNWKLNREFNFMFEFYPNWDQMIAGWNADGVRPMIYINPYFANLTDASITRNLFLEGDSLGYFIKDKSNNTYLIKSVSIEFAMIDFTNPQAWTWMKNIIFRIALLFRFIVIIVQVLNIIKDNLITEGKAFGWMLDFGEYTPFDVQTFDGTDPVKFHNAFPYEWARLNREAESAVANGDQMVAFMRSGSTLSPKYTDLFWMGDQLPTYDKFDGLQSAMMGLLNGGLSGFTMGHSDIGGYTSIHESLAGYNFTVERNKELLMRWIEMSAYSDIIMRSHPSNKPALNFQIFSDNETADFFANFVNQHVKLAPYKRQLMNEAVQLGYPIIRSLFMNYPSDSQARKVVDQFMLGDHIIMAPVFQQGQTFRSLYLPQGSWRHIWTNVTYSGPQTVTIYAPLGKPAVFYDSNWKAPTQFDSENQEKFLQ